MKRKCKSFSKRSPDYPVLDFFDWNRERASKYKKCFVDILFVLPKSFSASQYLPMIEENNKKHINLVVRFNDAQICRDICQALGSEKVPKEVILSTVLDYALIYGEHKSSASIISHSKHRSKSYNYVNISNSNQDSSKLYIIVNMTIEQQQNRMNSAYAWYERLNGLIVRRGYLEAENLFCATIGAAYAAMTRDKYNGDYAIKAKKFAERQLDIGKKLNDPHLIRKSNVFISYYYIFINDFDTAESILRPELVPQEEDDEIPKLAVAALFRLEKLREGFVLPQAKNKEHVQVE